MSVLVMIDIPAGGCSLDFDVVASFDTAAVQSSDCSKASSRDQRFTQQQFCEALPQVLDAIQLATISLLSTTINVSMPTVTQSTNAGPLTFQVTQIPGTTASSYASHSSSAVGTASLRQKFCLVLPQILDKIKMATAELETWDLEELEVVDLRDASFLLSEAAANDIDYVRIVVDGGEDFSTVDLQVRKDCEWGSVLNWYLEHRCGVEVEPYLSTDEFGFTHLDEGDTPSTLDMQDGRRIFIKEDRSGEEGITIRQVLEWRYERELRRRQSGDTESAK